MKLTDLLECTGYLVGQTGEHLWDCYGSNAFFIDFSFRKLISSVVFDTKTQVIYEITFADETKSEPFRYSNPKFIDKRKKEAKKRGHRFSQAWDDVDYIEVSAKQILEKIKSTFPKNADETYYTFCTGDHELDKLFSLGENPLFKSKKECSDYLKLTYKSKKFSPTIIKVRLSKA